MHQLDALKVFFYSTRKGDVIMDMHSNYFLLSLASIILLDIVLGGDNAVVIGMASRQLPTKMRKKAIYLGTAGAIIIRVLMTLMAAYLLAVPYLQALGSLILLPIAFKLLKPAKDTSPAAPTSASFASAIKTIIIADAAMGVDNVLAIAGASHGNLLLVFIGLAISIPIVVWGSQLIARLMDRFPWLATLGASLLAYTSASMILHDKMIGSLLQHFPFISYLLPVCFIGAILLYQKKRSS